MKGRRLLAASRVQRLLYIFAPTGRVCHVVVLLCLCALSSDQQSPTRLLLLCRAHPLLVACLA